MSDESIKKEMHFSSIQDLKTATIKLGNAKQYTRSKIEDYLSNVYKNAAELRQVSDWFYTSSGVYKQVIDTQVNLITLDNIILPDETTLERNQDKSYEEYFSRVKYYVNSLGLKSTTRRILKSLFKYGGYVGYERTNGKDVFIQTLPIDYCRIKYQIGNGEYQIEFNFKYFDNFWKKEDLDLAWEVFPPEFKKLYNRYKSDKKSSAPEWQMIDYKKTYCVLYDEDCEFFIPPYTGMFKPLICDEESKDLMDIGQKLDIIKIIVQKIPKDDKGNILLDKEDINFFHNMFKKVLPEGTTIMTTPMDVDSVSLSNVNKEKQDILGHSERNVFLNAGVNNALFIDNNGTFGINANIEILTANVYALLEKIATMFNMKINHNVVPTKNYTFNISFFRTTNLNIDKNFDRNNKLLSIGGALQPLISLTGMDANQYLTLLKIENTMQVKDELQVPLTMNTANSEDVDKQRGREEKSDEDASDSTNNNKDNGTNENKELLQ